MGSGDANLSSIVGELKVTEQIMPFVPRTVHFGSMHFWPRIPLHYNAVPAGLIMLTYLPTASQASRVHYRGQLTGVLASGIGWVTVSWIGE